MKFDNRAKVKQLQRVSDGLGGWVEEWTVIKSIDCFLSPVSVELQLKNYGFINSDSLKLFTKETIPEENIRIEANGKDFVIRQRLNHRRLTISILEAV